MKVTAIKTHKITKRDKDLFVVLDKYLSKVEEGSIVAIASKIVAICEGRIVPVEHANKDRLIKREADLYLPREENKYNLFLTIKNNLLAVSAGVDESNADGHYVLWPADPQKTANKIREYLTRRFRMKKVGVIITDGKSTPLRWGVVGAAVAHSGFEALRDLIGTPDIFGRKLKMTKGAVMDALAVAAVLVMGEGREQTPIAIITDVPFVKFQVRNPTKKELDALKISIDDDVYASILKRAPWRKSHKS